MNDSGIKYKHTQTGPWHILFIGLFILFLATVLLTDRQYSFTETLSLAVVLVFLTQSINYLTVRDEDEYLTIRFGKLPVFRRRLLYSRMTSVERSRSNWIDGFGVHCIPRRGWIYNLAGLDCVKIRMGKKAVRIGTDDLEGLFTFLETRIGKVE